MDERRYIREYVKNGLDDILKIGEFIDLHVHIGPEPIPRKFTLEKLVSEENNKLSGIGLKNHFYPTTPFIRSLDRTDNLTLIGSVVLNNYVGGLNPDVVYSTAKISDKPIIVWFPTINADNYLRRSEYEIRPEWVNENFKSRPSSEVRSIKIINKSGKLTEEASSVLRMIKDNNCILATGHISTNETERLVSDALGIGIDKIIITHPMYQLIEMPIDKQIEITQAKGVYIEVPYSMYAIDKISIEELVKTIKKVSPYKSIISSDVGQINMPSPSVALKEFTQLLGENGIDEESLNQMGKLNPRKLIT